MGGLADIIVADPPWKFASNSVAKPGRNAMRHYPVMTDAEITAIPVKEWTKPQALLLLWTTAPMLRRSMPIPEKWGFRYVSQIVWVKERIGTGFWVRNRHEPILVYRRSGFPCGRPAPFPDSVIEGQQREHSRKPDQLQDWVDAHWPDAVKLEMFPRQRRPGWLYWGGEPDKFPFEGDA